MIDYNNIAKKYAESKEYDSVRPSVERNGYKYFIWIMLFSPVI